MSCLLVVIHHAPISHRPLFMYLFHAELNSIFEFETVTRFHLVWEHKKPRNFSLSSFASRLLFDSWFAPLPMVLSIPGRAGRISSSVSECRPSPFSFFVCLTVILTTSVNCNYIFLNQYFSLSISKSISDIFSALLIIDIEYILRKEKS